MCRCFKNDEQVQQMFKRTQEGYSFSCNTLLQFLSWCYSSNNSQSIINFEQVKLFAGNMFHEQNGWNANEYEKNIYLFRS
jgi:hypothetical protein